MFKSRYQSILRIDHIFHSMIYNKFIIKYFRERFSNRHFPETALNIRFLYNLKSSCMSNNVYIRGQYQCTYSYRVTQ